MHTEPSGRPSVVGMSAIVEGPDTDILAILDWCLLEHVNRHVAKSYGPDIVTVGHTFHYGGAFDKLKDEFSGVVRLFRSKRYVTTTTVVSRLTWSSLTPFSLKVFLAERLNSAMLRVVLHLRDRKVDFDGDAFLIDMHAATNAFVNCDCLDASARYWAAMRGQPYEEGR